MSLYTDFYCDPVNGSNLNGGSDQNASPSFTSTNGNWNGTSIFTPTDGSTPANSVTAGQYASVCNDGTSGDGVYLAVVNSVAAGVNGAITLDTNITSGTAPTSSATARTIRVGGAFKGPNGTSGFPLNFISAARIGGGNSINYARHNLKNNAVYNITAAVTTETHQPGYVQGFTTFPGDGGKAIIDGGTSGASYALVTAGANDWSFTDLIFRNNGATGSASGVSTGVKVGCFFRRCVVHDVQGRGFEAANAVLDECEAYNCNLSNTANTGAFHMDPSLNPYGCHYNRCIAHDNTTANTRGFLAQNLNVSMPTFRNCVAATSGSHGIELGAASEPYRLENCVFYKNGGHGLEVPATSTPIVVENCLFVSNGTGAGSLYGVNLDNFNGSLFLSNCAFYNNKTGQVNFPANAVFENSNPITLTANPLTDPDNGNYSLNNVQGGGQMCRNAGRGNFLTTGLSKTTTEYPDVGLQHSDTGTIALVDGGAVFQTVTSW